LNNEILKQVMALLRFHLLETGIMVWQVYKLKWCQYI